MGIFNLALLLLGIAPAQADTNPPILPERDVVIDYTLSVPGRADAAYQVEYQASGELARITDTGRGLVYLANLPAGTAQILVPALNAVVAAPDLSSLTQQITNAENARFTPLSPGNYAGLSCQNYLITDAQGTATACLTPDGVALRFQGRNAQGSATVTASSITYAAQNPTDFSAPAGFAQITLPPGALAQLLGQ